MTKFSKRNSCSIHCNQSLHLVTPKLMQSDRSYTLWWRRSDNMVTNIFELIVYHQEKTSYIWIFLIENILIVTKKRQNTLDMI